MPAQLVFPLFVDDEILFSTKDAANDFFKSITIADADITTAGAVKKATLPNEIVTDVALTYNQFDVYDDEGVVASSNQVVTQQSIIDLKAKVIELQTYVNAIRLALINAGHGQ